ncbi:MAG: ParB/RepB/Spo0J family partition protein [Mesorhizobium sp.]|uniref:ParB/RepB/Spo0J family partition protein n=1 Tax=Mesorhizobium sp. TaxID=1871066 RepID=UPI0011FA0F1E|nr:ParB/RepB/Spo0J family partition protein [Mesorhizobium sp.]TIN36827.1 MAG: ParB/RepB/Spo0J family partition protein [Mesorhizobium sp.]TJU73569.1 MAG: ParB/RepB/Spo0J family partition protein [Mesorhizobium sp.]TJU86672.1 MAG: ParB/RepB/Spo0J family partition protein [Mesorhizobium sp.]
MTLQTRTAALADLELDDDINARRHRNDEGIEELKASIRAHGLAQSLRVRPSEKAGRFRIVAGSRRYRVLCELATSGDTAAGVPVTEEFPVPVIIGYEDDDQTAREISQAENLIRLPQHEADTYETFRELADRGLDEAQIAARFGIDPKRVKRMLALGRLSPVILDWWRSEEQTNETSATVRAFTLAPSIEEQEKLFKKLFKQGDVRAWAVKRALGADNPQAARNIKIAGLEAYKAAGGQMTTDLFGDNHVIADPDIAEKVAEEKIASTIAGLKAEGWSWVSMGADLGYYWEHSWKREKPGDGKATADEKKQITKLKKLAAKDNVVAAGHLNDLWKTIAERQWTPDQLGKAGAVVKIGHYGDLEICRGVVKPQAEKKASSASSTPKEKGPPTISNALHQRLSGQATLAVRQALQQEPRVGLIALLAGFVAHRRMHVDSPVRVYHEGFGKTYGEDKETFASVFARLMDMTDEELFQVAAGCAAEAVHMERPYIGKPPFDANAAPLAASIQPDLLTAALQETFDAADYFGGASKPFVITAIREALNDDEARKADKMKKAELTAFALANVPQTGWLPPELRAPTYSGPGEVPEVAAPDEHDPNFDQVDEESEDELEDA